MKTQLRKIISLCLVAALLLSAIPMQVFAEPDGASGGETAYTLSGVSFSDSVYEERATGVIVTGAVGNPGSEWRPKFYVLPSNSATLHRMSFWSSDEMDTSKLSFTGVVAAGSITRSAGSVSSIHQETKYLYRVPVQIPKDGCSVDILYDGSSIGQVSIARKEIEGCYIGEALILSENNGAFTMEFSGLNIPSDPTLALGELEYSDEPETAVYKKIWQSSAAASAGNLGVYTAVLAPAVEDTGVPWLSILINDAAVSGYDNITAQIAEVHAFAGDTDTPETDITQPPEISNESIITSATISFTVTPGDYPSMRYKLDSAAFSDWQDTKSFTLSLTEGSYGSHTVSFEFKTQDGETLSINKTISYVNGTAADAPGSVFIKDAAKKKLSPVGSNYTLTAGTDYFPSAVYGNKEDGIRSLEVLVYSGSDQMSSLADLVSDRYMTVIDMVRVSGTNTYEAKDAYRFDTGNYRIGVRVKQGQYDAAPGALTEVTADAYVTPLIYKENAPEFSKRIYSDQLQKYMIAVGSEVSGRFSGTSGEAYQGKIILYWNDANGTERSTTQPVDHAGSFNGWYFGDLTIPDEAVSINSLVYRIELKADSSVAVEKSIDLTSDYILASSVRFSGIPDSYSGAELEVVAVNNDPRAYLLRKYVELNGQSDVLLFDFTPGNYKYTITGQSGVITEGTFTITANSGLLEVPIAAQELADLNVSVADYDSLYLYTMLRYRIYFGAGPDDYTAGILQPDSSGKATIRQLHAKQSDGNTPTRIEFFADVNDYYPVELFGDNVDQYGVLSYELSSGTNTLSLALRRYNTKSLSGTVTDPLGNPLSEILVSATMTASVGWEVEGKRPVISSQFFGGAYARSDINGKYELSGIWADKDVTINVFSSGGNWFGSPAYCDESFASPANETEHDIQLRYRNYGAVRVDLLAVLSAGAAETEADCRILQDPEILFEGARLNCYGGDNGVFYLNDNRVGPGSVITVRYNYGNEGTVEGSDMGVYEYPGASTHNGNYAEQTVTLDEYGDGSVKFMAKPLAVITASPIPTAIAEDEDLEVSTRYKGYLVVLDNEKNVVGTDSGYGELRVDSIPDGRVQALALYLDTKDTYYHEYLASLQNISDLVARFRDAAGGGQIVWVQNLDVSASDNIDITENSKPTAAAGALLLGGYSYGIKTEILPDFPGWVQVKINLIRRDNHVRLDQLTVKNAGDPNDANDPVLYSAYLNGERMTRYWSPDRFQTEINNTFIEDQGKDPYLMFFTKAADQGGGTAIATADIEIRYNFFDKWENGYANATGWTSDELHIEVNTDPFDLQIADTAVFDELNIGKENFGVITAHLYGQKGDRIEIYDGDVKAAEAVMSSIRQDVRIRLSDPEYFGVHRLHAERVHNDGSRDYSETRPVSLVNRANTIYLNEIRWIHRNDTRLEQWHFHEIEDMTETTFRYYPAKASIISFRLNNVREGEIDNVRFITSYHGAETSFRTRFIGSGVDSDTGRPWCEYSIDPEYPNPKWGKDVQYFRTPSGQVAIEYVTNEIGHYAEGINPEGKKYPLVGLGYFEDFNVEYELLTRVDDGASEEEILKAQLDSYYKATAGTAPDMNSIAQAEFPADTAERAKAALPSAIRDGYLNGTIQSTTNSTADTYSYTLSNGNTGISYESDLSDKTSYDVDALKLRMQTELEEVQALYDLAGKREFAYTDPVKGQGQRSISWAKYDTLQGPVYIRQVKTDYTVYGADGKPAGGSKVDVDIEQEIYAPESVMNAIKNGTTVEEEREKATAAVNVPKVRTAPGLFGALPKASSAGGGLMAVNQAVDEGMGHLSTLSNIHGGLDIYQDIRIEKLGEESRFISKNFGRGMSALGVGLTAYDIAKGVQGKEPDALFTALNSLDMGDAQSRKAREALTNEILSYQDVRTQKYLVDSAINGGLAASGVVDGVPPHVKLGLLAGGIGYNAIGNEAQGYMDNEFDSIMKSILLELNRQDQRNVKARVELEKELYTRWEKYAEVMDWGDIWEGDQKVTRKQRIIREVEKDLNLIFNNEKMPRFNMRESFPKINVYVDPSGYVFEGIPDERVGGITATLYQNIAGNAYKQWEDTNSVIADRQQNPMVTTDADPKDPDKGGRYGWMTPYGTFKVAFTDPSGSYLDAETKNMTVPPEHTTVNIGLLSAEAPEVLQVETLTGSAVAVTFNKYMQMESLVQVSPAENAKIIGNTDSYDSSASVLSLYDADGNLIPGKISFPSSFDTLDTGSGQEASTETGKYRVANNYYRSGIYQVDEIASDWFANKIIFTPDDPANFDPENSSLMVSKIAQSYSGVGMTEDYVKNVAAAERETAPKIFTITLDPNGGSGVPATLITSRDGKLSDLPQPVKEGFSFAGWTGADGSAVTTATVFEADTTIYANWTGGQSGSSDSSDSISGIPAAGLQEIGEITVPEPTTGLSADSFGDVGSGRWSAEAITYVASRGIFNGNGNGSFSPAAPMTRAMTAQVLYNLAGKPATTNNLTYTDKDSLLWFTDAVAWASNVGLVTGNTDGSFKGNNSITREEFVTIIYRFAQKIGLDTAPRAELTGFSDGNAVRDYAKDAMQWAVAVGLIKGSNGKLDAGFGASREQIATIVMRFCQMIEAKNAAKQ